MPTQEQGKGIEAEGSEGGEEGKVVEGGCEGVPEVEHELQVSRQRSAAGQQTSPASRSGEGEQASAAQENREREQAEQVSKDYKESKKAAQVKKAAKAAAKRAKLRTRAEAILRIAERETSHLHYAPGKWYPSSRPVKLPPGTQLPFKSLGAIRRDLDVYLDYHRREMEDRSAADRDTDLAYEEKRPSQSTGKIPTNYSRFSIVATRNANRVFQSHLRHLRRALWVREDENNVAYWKVDRLFWRYVGSYGEVANDGFELWNKIMTFRQDVPLGLS